MPSRPSRRTPRRVGSLRVRLTAAVTVVVGATLTLAAVMLVGAISRSLVGEVRDAAVRDVDLVADALAHGEPATFQPRSLAEIAMVVQVQDEHGTVVQTIPSLPVDAVPQRSLSPEEQRLVRDRVRNADQGTSMTSTDGLVVASRTVSTPDGRRTVLAVSRLGPITRSVNLVADSLLVATPLLTLLVAVSTWFAVDRALRPIEAIRRHAERISHSTLGERLPPQATGDEVARLTATLNEMLSRLEEGARRQREFVSDASHELRTPLAAMRADLEVTLSRRSAADWPAMAHRLLDDHRRLDRLTSDLLLLARLDDAGGVARREQVRLDELVEGELRTVSRAELTADLHPAEVTGVVAELVRLVRNLLENADRHAGTRVGVELRVCDGDAVLIVDDDGPGVPEEQRSRVFDRFYRLDSSRARTSGGAGLGLAMVRRVVEGHQGSVQIETSPSGGARFEVRLPLSARSKAG